MNLEYSRFSVSENNFWPRLQQHTCDDQTYDDMHVKDQVAIPGNTSPKG